MALAAKTDTMVTERFSARARAVFAVVVGCGMAVFIVRVSYRGRARQYRSYKGSMRLPGTRHRASPAASRWGEEICAQTRGDMHRVLSYPKCANQQPARCGESKTHRAFRAG